MPKQHDLVRTANHDNEESQGSFASLADDSHDEGTTSTTPIRGPMEESPRNDGMTSLHHIFGTVNSNISMISIPFSSPMQGLHQLPAWSTSWNEQRPPNYLFPRNDSPLQVHHILDIINSVFETLDEEHDDDCLIGNTNKTPMAPQ